MKPVDLAGWLSYLEQLHPAEIELGLERIRAVAERLRLPRLARRIVTVGGTNGKGSTCALLAGLLQAQGLSVGIYSSPHFVRFNERVQLNGHEVSDAAFCAALSRVEDARDDISLTFFEMTTLAAFWLFAEADLDWVILEVGLGGRLDAVNLVDPDLAVITGIALDHCDWLGDSRADIAREKAGIMRAETPCLCGDPEPPVILAEQAAVLQAPLLQLADAFRIELPAAGDPPVWHWQGQRDGQRVSLAVPVLDLPPTSVALALQAYALQGLPWVPEQLVATLQSVRMTGRFDRCRIDWQGQERQVILDVGHNPQAADYLARRLAEQPLQGRRYAVFGLMADKDLTGVLEPLLPLIDEWKVVTLATPRALPAERLLEGLESRQAAGEVCESVVAALEACCTLAGPGDQILVFGSFYCVADSLAWLEQHERRAGL